MSYYPLIVQEHEKLQVVRGDLYPGGLKCRVIHEFLATHVKESNVVYAGCYYGHSGYALGLAGLLTGKRVSLLMPEPVVDTYIQRQALSLNSIECRLVGASHQDQVFNAAEKFATDNSFRLVPVGFQCKEVFDIYVDVIRSACRAPEEVWVVGGSGLTARCLQYAWPKSQVNVVDLNVRKGSDFGSPCRVWTIPEQLNEEAELTPPWPAARYYDAKIWRIVKQHARLGAVVWSIA